MFSNIFKIIILLLLLQPYKTAWSIEKSANQVVKIPFKMGFEFQESSSLCKWANDNEIVQKKPLFFVTLQNDAFPSWHVVIDTNDIEFVTRPFCRGEREQVQICLESIINSINVLSQLLISKKEITFNDWINELLNVFLPSVCLISCSRENYAAIHKETIILPGDKWKPKVSPQVTIQHPLEFTIPLYFGLFGFKSNYMLPFSASVPGRNFLLEAQEQGNSAMFWQIFKGLQQKTMGFMFLHALTLVQMTPVNETTDFECLTTTQNCLNQAFQVDAKMMLALLSRRPFSHMWSDLQSNANYSELFKKFMGANLSFSFYQVPSKLKLTNYAEQFFDTSNGKPLDLCNFINFFEETFLNENRDVLLALLRKGVVSTCMIRNFRKDVKIEGKNISVCSMLDNFFEDSLNSVQTPNQRYVVNPLRRVIEALNITHDILSPPPIILDSNAMGFFKNTAQHDPQYGEAIIEVRGICDVQPWFLRKCNFDESISGSFLTNPDKSLVDHGIALFRFLTNFGTQQDFEDIALAMPFAFRKY